MQLGIRTVYDRENTPFKVLEAPEVNALPVTEIVEKVRAVVGNNPVYLTFDVDCLDPAFAPGTGTPVCGGLTSDKALQIVRGLQGLNIVGMDIVEVAPAYDSADITALAAATVAGDMLYLQALLKRG